MRTFVDAVRRVAAGGMAFPRPGGRQLTGAEPPQRGSGHGDRLADGARERETLELIAQGRTNAAIARDFVVTLGAVEKHIANIFAKLDLPATDDDHRRVLAVLTYLRATT